MSTPLSNSGNRAHHFTHHDEPHHAIFPSGRDFFAWLAIGGVGAVLLFLSLTAGEIFSPGISTGDVAERDIRSPADATVIDGVATKAAIETARQHVIPEFVIDRSHDKASLEKIKQAFQAVKQLQDVGVAPVPELVGIGLAPKDHLFALTAHEDVFQQLTGNGAPPADEYIALLRKRLLNPLTPKSSLTSFDLLKTQRAALSSFLSKNHGVDNNLVLIALTLKPSTFYEYENAAIESANRVCRNFERFPVTNTNEWQDIVIEFVPDGWDKDLRAEVATAISAALEPNLVIDPSGTKNKADYAVRMVKPVTREIKQGDIVVRRGEVITDERQEVLQLLSIKSVKSTALLLVLGVSLMAALGFSGLFLLTYEPKHFFSTTSIALMYTIGIVTSIATSVLGNSYPQFVPIPGAALLLTIFFRRRVAAALILPIIVLFFVEGLVSGAHLLALTIAALAAIISYSKRRNSLVYTGLIVGVAQALGYLLAYGIGKLLLIILGERVAPYLISWLSAGNPDLSAIALQFAGGIASSIVAIGSLPFLENIFGMVTPYRLIELTDAEQPLLRQLEEKAPGTYQHSLAVANLAEAGAKAIHADASLVRAGALYHDIGKMVKPRFFIENQLGATNPHDSMTPEESRSRVLAHVTDGIELARKHALPRAVEDFIPMHQGTTLMAYFYHKACQRDGVENVDSSFYRYPGPKPQSKETAIVMLADVSEAVTHSMKDPSEKEVEEAIEKVFENRWQDGQFSESTLTHDELQRVKLAFVRVWRTLHHDRLKYPSTTTGRMAVPPSNNADGNGGPAPQGESGDMKEGSSAEAHIHSNGSDHADSGPCDCVIAEFGPPEEQSGMMGNLPESKEAVHRKED